MDVGATESRAEEVFSLMGERLSVGGRDLAARTRKAGRRLPRRIRREAQYLAEAAKLAQNPKLARMVDPGRVAHAHATCLRHLQSIDGAERRRAYTLGVLGSIGFAVFFVGAAFIAVLVWREYL